ncbi:hypothetical protein Poli38472_004382 [Pythium oligandrum]|uniref:Uncharacterized protein n=1 Tax=Pythium oligandrum TaxID=41045 RepID=A0A8K1CAA9_PYTOL|nr:hypothetical protein Poli38472_004382 [Pythium oligandrum]|eukprot:TMW59313.1 hypothetical protein Poli38472_004382 [Pythium oligandrum]
MLQVNLDTGLDGSVAQQRLWKNGMNTSGAAKKSSVHISPRIMMMAVVTVASVAFLDFVEMNAFIVVFLLYGIMDRIQTTKTNAILDAMHNTALSQCTVIRDGHQHVIASKLLVVGDIVVLTGGDQVPADMRLVSITHLKANETVLMGEQEDVEKKHAVHTESLTPDNMVFALTSVTAGEAIGVVVATGQSTLGGSIAKRLKGESKMSVIRRLLGTFQSTRTPLQHALYRLSQNLIVAGLGVLVLMVCIRLARGNRDPRRVYDMAWEQTLVLALAIVVSALPITLPSAVAISVICTGISGSLTKGELIAVKVWGDSVEYDITEPVVGSKGDILRDGVSQVKSNIQVRATLLSSALCSNANTQKSLTKSTQTPTDQLWEAPLVVAAAKAGIWREEVSETFKRVAEVPFSSSRKMMITVNELPAGMTFENVPLPADATLVANVKGAPNYILKNCTQYVRANGSVGSLRASDRTSILEAVDELSSQALRVLAVAIRPMAELPYSGDEEDIDIKFESLCQPLIFVGLMASIDPAREGVKDSIKKARDASVRTVMITGDYHKTAVAIAKNIDLLPVGADCDEEAIDCGILRPNGKYLMEHDLDEITSRVSVFARAKPEDKIEIVKSLQRQGHVAAMTGDGVNDAPALKEADIGVAMGIAGTAVAKGASDMILTDDNFCSIVSAVEKGREIYANIQRFVCFLLTRCLGQVAIVFISVAIGLPDALRPLQILVFNVFISGLAAIALSLEKGDGTVMTQCPRPRHQQVVNKRLWVLVLINTLLMTVGALIVFLVGLSWNFGGEVSMNGIMTDILRSDSNKKIRDAVCRRWLGISRGWRDVADCWGLNWRHGLAIPSDVLCYRMNDNCVDDGIARAQAMTFIYLTILEVLRMYSARSLTRSMFWGASANKAMLWAAVGAISVTVALIVIPKVRDIFGFARLEWFLWLLPIALAVVAAVIIEGIKRFYRVN